jgi:hypothetical protein
MNTEIAAIDSVNILLESAWDFGLIAATRYREEYMQNDQRPGHRLAFRVSEPAEFSA